MGKGGGRGRGKGGCECDSIFAVACCLCTVLLGGPILIAVGAGLLAAASRNQHGHNVAAIDSAVAAWTNASAPNGWQQFGQLRVFAVLTPGTFAGSECDGSSVQLKVDTDPNDLYKYDATGFQGVQQLRLTSPGLSFRNAAQCDMQVTLLQQLPNSSTNVTLAQLSAIYYGSSSYSILLDKADGPNTCASTNDMCYSSSARRCSANCEDYFKGQFSCNSGGRFSCSLTNVYFSNLAVKVSYNATAADGAGGAYLPDLTAPGLGRGGNVLPNGFVRADNAYGSSLDLGPLFQVPNIGPSGPPLLFTLTVRSAADPWLAYMQATGGSGQLGVPKRILVTIGVITLLLGLLGALFWCVAAFYAWRMLCSRNRPTQRPSGVGGFAWDLANRYGGTYAPAIGVPVHGTGPDGYPTAQPLYAQPGSSAFDPAYPYGSAAPGQPVAGYPYPGAYPPPYGQPPPPGAGYPPYPGAYPPPPLPPPGSGVEMTQLGGPGAQYYGYPPPPPPGQQQGSTPAPGAGASAAYSYPYPYAYPPYGQQPPPQQQQQPAPAAAGGGDAAAAATSAVAPQGAAADAGASASDSTASHGEAGPSNGRLMRPPGYAKLD